METLLGLISNNLLVLSAVALSEGAAYNIDHVGYLDANSHALSPLMLAPV